MVTTIDLFTILPELILAVLAMALLMYGVFRGDKAVNSVSWLAVAAIAITAIAVSSQSDAGHLAFKGQFIVDQFAVFMKWLILLGSALTLLMSLNYN